MTFRERLAQEHPDCIGPQPGCEKGCPSDYGYEPIESKSHCQNRSCTDCWAREMPEDQKYGGYISLDTDKLEPPTQTLEDLLIPGKMPETDHDPVNHPTHYTAGKIEVIDCIESMIAPIKDPEQAFLAGQVLKYIARYSLKNGVEDLKKSQWYLNRLIGKVGE